jgi:hypothetical protein
MRCLKDRLQRLLNQILEPSRDPFVMLFVGM